MTANRSLSNAVRSGRCVVPSCTNVSYEGYKGSELAWFNFPTQNPSKQAKWFESIGINTLPNYTRTNKICSIHFTELDFDTNSVFGLKRSAVPSIFYDDDKIGISTSNQLVIMPAVSSSDIELSQITYNGEFPNVESSEMKTLPLEPWEITSKKRLLNYNETEEPDEEKTVLVIKTEVEETSMEENDFINILQETGNTIIKTEIEEIPLADTRKEVDHCTYKNIVYDLAIDKNSFTKMEVDTLAENQFINNNNLTPPSNATDFILPEPIKKDSQLAISKEFFFLESNGEPETKNNPNSIAIELKPTNSSNLPLPNNTLDYENDDMDDDSDLLEEIENLLVEGYRGDVPSLKRETEPPNNGPPAKLRRTAAKCQTAEKSSPTITTTRVSVAPTPSKRCTTIDIGFAHKRWVQECQYLKMNYEEFAMFLLDKLKE